MAATVGRGGTYLFAGYYAQDRSLICASTPPGPGGGALASDVPASPGVDLAPGDVGADLWILRASSPVYGPRGEPLFSVLQRRSKPGLRVYVKAVEIPRPLAGMGIANPYEQRT